MGKYANTIGLVLEGLLEEAQDPRMTIQMGREKVVIDNAKLVRDLVKFESRLAAATPDEEDAEDVTKYYNKRTVEETRSLLPQLSIPDIIANFAPRDSGPENLIVASPSYLKAVAEVLIETSVETLQAYLVWKTVQAYNSKIESDALKPLKRFNNVQLGKDPDATEERWRTCIKDADRSLGRVRQQLS